MHVYTNKCVKINILEKIVTLYSTARIHCPLTRRVHPARALILNI